MIEEYLFLQTPEIQDKILVLRSIILKASSEIEETLKFKTAFYVYKGMFCYFSVEAKSKRLYIGFCDGHLMADPKQDMVSDGNKQIRKLFVDKIDSSLISTLDELLKEAIWVKDILKSGKKSSVQSKKRRIL